MKCNLKFPLFETKSRQDIEEEVKKIVAQYGSPIYIFHEHEFLANLKSLCDAFQSIYTNYIPAYSYKTNYTPYLCGLIKHNGGYAEVVSDMEYFLAKKLGYANNQIIYNGPCKGDMLTEHLLNGGISNIDNEHEAITIASIAKLNPDKHIHVGIRLNLDIGANYISRFGLELDSPSLDKVLSILNKYDNISLCGVHCHISRARGAQAWQNRINLLLYAADKYVPGIPDYIDVGSGMFAEMDNSLAKQFDFHIPTYGEYASIVANAMAKHYAQSCKKPILFSEPGTTLVSRYFSLITTVNNIKNIQNKIFVTVDSSYHNAGEICKMKKLPYRVIPMKISGKNDFQGPEMDIMGYTCLEQDCLYKNFENKLREGDLLMFGNVGGYSIVSKPPFIHPNCAVLSVTDEGNIVQIKRSETYDDIFKTFKF